MNNKELIEYYFELSNTWDIDGISRLLDEYVSYSSDNVWLHFGKAGVLTMKQKFFWGLKARNWDIQKIEEISENIFRIEFLFKAQTVEGKNISRPGVENIIVYEWKLRHIEVRNI